MVIDVMSPKISTDDFNFNVHGNSKKKSIALSSELIRSPYRYVRCCHLLISPRGGFLLSFNIDDENETTIHPDVITIKNDYLDVRSKS